MRTTLTIAAAVALVLVAALAAASGGAAVPNVATAAKVSVGSPSDETPLNHQNEPAVAIDAHNPNVVVAAAIDYVDKQRCPQVIATQEASCEDLAFPPQPGAGRTAAYFSFDRGRSWTQPVYTGKTGRDCVPNDVCEGSVGPISTLPWYYEAGLQSDGDPAVAIGPLPDGKHFSWANGSRVYIANLVSDLPDRSPLKSSGGIGVSRIDNPTPSRLAKKSSWRPPVVLESSNPTWWEDKDQIWVDNAESSPFFGNAYLCFGEVRGEDETSPLPMLAATSTDGGDHWKETVVARGQDPDAGLPGYAGCTIRTDSHGVVYLFAVRYNDPDPSRLPLKGEHVVFESYDGGKRWTEPRRLFGVTAACFFMDPLSGSCVMDGYTGSRVGSVSAAPAVDIANGAPTGAGATDLIVDAWADGGPGLNHEQARVSWSADRGRSWAQPVAVSLPGDRPLYAAPAISPTGDRAYVVYEAVTSPWRGSDMNSPRPYHGVFLTASVGAGGPGPWQAAYNGPLGDLRASFPPHSLHQERVGDYLYAAASRDYGLGVWIDTAGAAVCPAVQAWRRRSIAAGADVIPAPWPLADCPSTFSNTDVWVATTG